MEYRSDESSKSFAEKTISDQDSQEIIGARSKEKEKKIKIDKTSNLELVYNLNRRKELEGLWEG